MGSNPKHGCARRGRRLSSSLSARCIAVLVAYAAVVASIVLAARAGGSYVLETSFPTVYDAADHSRELARDEFGFLGSDRFARASTVVFDGRDDVLFASDDTIAENITPDDLALIGDADERSTYLVLEDRTSDAAWRVERCALDAGDDTARVVGYCLLDRDLNVVGGDLFGDRKALTPREFDLVKGVYDSGRSVAKLEYETASGEPRTLVMAFPVATEEAYDEALDDAGRVWLAAVPAVVGATALLAVAEVHVIRRSAAPVSRVIGSWRSGQEPSLDPEAVDVELRPILEGFYSLMRRLKASNAEKQRIVADLSHDLKTPLTVIRGYAQALRDGMVPAGGERACADVLCAKADDAAALLDRLVEYAGMSHPEFAPNLRDVDLARTVERFAEGFAAQAGQTGCTVEVDVPAEPVPARADAALLDRLLGNLASNACVHNGPGTAIRISCRVERRGGDRRAVVTVADDGRGMPPSIAGRAFDAFVTGNEARTSGKGTGLGLSIARRCAELNGGTLSLVSTGEGKGAVFELELPLARRPRA